MQNVSEYMLVLALCLVLIVFGESRRRKILTLEGCKFAKLICKLWPPFFTVAAVVAFYWYFVG